MELSREAIAIIKAALCKQVDELFLRVHATFGITCKYPNKSMYAKCVCPGSCDNVITAERVVSHVCGV